MVGAVWLARNNWVATIPEVRRRRVTQGKDARGRAGNEVRPRSDGTHRRWGRRQGRCHFAHHCLFCLRSDNCRARRLLARTGLCPNAWVSGNIWPFGLGHIVHSIKASRYLALCYTQRFCNLCNRKPLVPKPSDFRQKFFGILLAHMYPSRCNCDNCKTVHRSVHRRKTR